MNSPIQNRTGCVFIPVSDMNRAQTWYARLLGIPPAETSHEGKIADVPMAGETQLILDGHKPVVNSSQPILFFWSEDLQATHHFLQNLEIDLISPIEDIGSVLALLFRDPDNNQLMVCKRNESQVI